MELQMQILLEKIQEQMKKQTITITESVTKNVVQQINERFKKLDEENKQLKNEVKELKEKVKGLEMAKKKSNILLFGIKEDKHDGLNLVKNIIENLNGFLGLNLQEQEIVTAFRIGQVKSSPRPILISFVSHWRKMETMRSKTKLPEGIYVKEDYTKEILETRKALQPKLDEERKKGNIAYLKVDKLIVKNQADVNREKRKRDPCYLPHLSIPHDLASKKANTTNAYEYMARARNRIERTASKRWRGSVRRVVSAAVYNLSCFTHGCSTGWVSGVLGSEALTGGAWLAALPCLVALPAAPFFAVLADARGRKAGAFCICISFIISWSLAAWCGPRGVWAARVAAGAGGAGALALAPLYCAEIAPRTRGLAAMPALACSCGILFAYAAGGILSAHALSLSMAVPPAVLLVSLIWLPETPSFLISVGRIQDAAKIICWFDGSDFREDLTDVIEQQEVKIRTTDCYGRREPIRRQDSDTFQPMLKRSSGLDSNSEKKREQSACRELFRHRRSRRALFSCLVVLSAAAGSGAGAVNSFAAAVLRHSTHSVPHLNLTAYNYTMYNGTAPRPLFEPSEAGSILCGAALVLGAAVATISVDRLGRKMLLLWSCSGITCCLAILGAYCDPNLRLHSLYSHRLWPYKRTHNLKEKGLQLTENITGIHTSPEWKNYTNDLSKYRENLGNDSLPGEWKVQNITNGEDVVNMDEQNLWAPVALMSVVLFLYNIGLGSVPYVLISELFTINVRSLASSLLISWMWLSSFFILRYYGTIAVSVGLHGTYYICASITFLGSLYIFFIIPETKGKAQEQIDEDLDGPLLVLKRKRKDRDQR